MRIATPRRDASDEGAAGSSGGTAGAAVTTIDVLDTQAHVPAGGAGSLIGVQGQAHAAVADGMGGHVQAQRGGRQDKLAVRARVHVGHAPLGPAIGIGLQQQGRFALHHAVDKELDATGAVPGAGIGARVLQDVLEIVGRGLLAHAHVVVGADG